MQLASDQPTSIRGWRRLAAGALWALAALMAFKLGLMIRHGGETALILFAGKGIYAGHPLKYTLVGLAAWLGGYLLLVAPGYRARDWGRFAGRLILLALSTGLSLLAGEIGVRAYYIKELQANSLDRLKEIYRAGLKPEVHTSHPMSYIIRPTDDPHLVYELQPNLEMDFGHRRVHINSAGLRSDREYPLARQPHSVRIAGVGDSGMFGWDCEQGEDYLSVLETNLNQRSPGARYEVLNFAVPGYNTRLEAETVRRKVLPYQPDVVVVGWCENDFELPFFMLEQSTFQRRGISFLYLRLFDRAYPLKDTLSVKFTERRAFNETNVLPEIRSGAGVDGVRQALRMLAQLSRERRFHLLVFGPMNQDIIPLCREAGVAYYNTYEKIPSGRYPADYAIHFMHPSPKGHRALAEHLEQELRARGWLQPRTDVQAANP